MPAGGSTLEDKVRREAIRAGLSAEGQAAMLQGGFDRIPRSADQTRLINSLQGRNIVPLDPAMIGKAPDADLLASDLDIDNLVLEGLRQRVGTRRSERGHIPVYTNVKLRIEESLLDAVCERTIEGASTLTLTISDPDWEILNSGIFDMNEDGKLDVIDVRIDKLWFRLVKVNPVGDVLTLTFEDRDVAILRTYDKPMSIARKKRTRAQFIEMVVREPKGRRIKFFAPEKLVRQPIEKASRASEQVSAPDDPARSSGVSRSARLTVKGAPIDAEQRRNINIALERAGALGAPRKATLALLEACIAESTFRNLTYGDSSSVGILQLLDIHGSADSRRNVADVIDKFLKDGFASLAPEGAIELSRKHPDWTPAQVAAACQGNRDGASSYDDWGEEAIAMYEAGGGASAAGGPNMGSIEPSTRSRVKQYRFYRGKRGERENSWDCIQRNATEVQWRAFMRNGELWYVSETWLMNRRVLAELDRDTPGVDSDSFGFDWDEGARVKEMTFTISADRWAFPPGSVIKINNSGPANGRWLVTKISKSLFESFTTITLGKEHKPKPEPAAEVEQTSTGAGGQGGAGTSSASGGSKRDCIVKAAERSMTIHTGYNRYSQAGALTSDPTPSSARSDCSQWVRAIYLQCGAGDPGTWTGDQNSRGRRTNNPKPGDLVMMSNHVELYVGGGKTIGHGSPPIDYGSVSYWRQQGAWFVTYDFLD